MAVGPYHRDQDEYEALLRGELRRREQRGLPGQGMPRAFMPPVGQPVALASRPGPSTLDPAGEAEPAAAPAPAPSVAAPVRSAGNSMASGGGAPMAERGKGWQYADAILSGLAGGGSYNQQRYDRLDAEMEAEHKADPRSDASARVRQSMGPTLMKLGLGADEINMLSAADISTMSAKGDLLLAVVEARQKAAANKEKAAAEAAALKEKREYDEGRFKTEAEITGNTAGAKLERAAVVGGQQEDRAQRMAFLQDSMQRARAQDQHVFQEEIARLRRQWELEDRGRQVGEQRGVKLDTDTKEYARALQTTGVPKARTQINSVKQMIEAAKAANDGAIFAGKDDYVRRGPPAGWAMMSAPGEKLMREIQKLRNIEIKDLSGAAVSNSEMGRVAAAQGANVFDSAEALESWVGSMEQALQSDEQNLLGGFDPAVIENYSANLRANQGGAKRKPAAAPAKGRLVKDADSDEWEDLP